MNRFLNRATVTFMLLATISSVQVAMSADSATRLESAHKLLEDAMQSGDTTKADQAAAIIAKEFDTPPVNTEALAAPVQNLAQLYQLKNEQAKSLEWWRRLIKLEPDNWRAWSKIVQCSQALNDPKLRDEARDKVLELNKAGKIDAKMFCREQFKVGTNNVMAMEYFVPDTKRGVELAFLLSAPAAPQTILKRYTFGEMVTDTEIARQMKTIKPDEHIYSIDGFTKERQWLVQMLKQKPSYEKIRDLVIADLDKDPTKADNQLIFPTK